MYTKKKSPDELTWTTLRTGTPWYGLKRKKVPTHDRQQQSEYAKYGSTLIGASVTAVDHHLHQGGGHLHNVTASACAGRTTGATGRLCSTNGTYRYHHREHDVDDHGTSNWEHMSLLKLMIRPAPRMPFILTWLVTGLLTNHCSCQ